MSFNTEKYTTHADHVVMDLDCSKCNPNIDNVTKDGLIEKNALFEKQLTTSIYDLFKQISELEELSRKMRYALEYAWLWHVGNGSEDAEKDCMNRIREAIDLYTQSFK